MAGFDPDEYGGYDGEDDELYAVENAYSEADRTSRPMKILLDVYKKYQQKDPIADRVAEDSEALQWLDDYWQYVCMVEHGNEGSVEDVGGFVGFARSFSDYAPEIAEYLLYDDIDEIDGDARGLYERFIPIAQRYGGNVSKMKKSFEDEVFNNGEYLGDTYYGEPYRSRRSKYYKYNDKFYEFTEGTDQYGGLKEVTDFVMTHPRAGYEMYEEVRDNMPMKSTKKSIHDMIAQCRQNNNSLVKSRGRLIDDGRIVKSDAIVNDLVQMREYVLDIATYLYNEGSKYSNQFVQISDDLYYMVEEFPIMKGKVKINGMDYEVPDRIEDKFELLKELGYSLLNRLLVPDYDDLRKRLAQTLDRIEMLVSLIAEEKK